MSQPSNTSSTINTDTSSAKSAEQSKVVSKENLSRSLDILFQAKRLLDQELKDGIIQDELVLNYINGFTKKMQRSLDTLQHYIGNFALQDTQTTIAAEYTRINGTIDSQKKFITDSGGNALDKRHALTLLNIVQRSYAALYEASDEKKEQKTQPIWETRRLYLQQQVIPSKEAKAAFEKVLVKIKELADEKYTDPGLCYFSYVRPDDVAQKDNSEEWVQDFLVQVRHDLRKAGIAMNIDKLDNHDGNAHTYMSRFNDAGFIIPVGTPSLLRKHQIGVGAICSELVIINKKRQKSSQSILPILLVGDLSSSFPVYFGDYYKIIYTWHQNSYQANLKELIKNLYNVGVGDQAYLGIWEEFEKSYPELASRLEQPDTQKIMEDEAKRLKEEAQKREKAVLKMYGGSMSNSTGSGSSANFAAASPVLQTTTSSQSVSNTAAIISDTSTHQPQVIARANGGNAVAVNSINASISNSPGAMYFGDIGSIGSLVIQQPTTSAQQLTTPSLNRGSKTTVAEEKNSSAANYFHARCDSNSAHTKFFGPGRITREEAEKDLKLHNEEYKHTNGRITPTSELDNGVGCEPTLA